MTDIPGLGETRTPAQMAHAAILSPNAWVTIQEPDGPVVSVPASVFASVVAPGPRGDPGPAGVAGNTNMVRLTGVGGTGNAVTANVPGGDAVTDGGAGQVFRMTAAAANTGAVTLAVPGVFGGAAVNLLLPTGDNLPAGLLAAGRVILLGVAAGNWTLLSPSAVRQSFVLLTTASAGVSLVCDKGAQLISPTGEDIEFSVVVPADKPAGGPTISITGFGGPFGLFDRDGSGDLSAANLWRAGDRISFRRQKAGEYAPGNWALTAHVNAFADAADLDIPGTRRPVNSQLLVSATARSRDDAVRLLYLMENELLSKAKPVRLIVTEDWRLIIDVRPNDLQYRDGYRRLTSDMARFEFLDLKGMGHLPFLTYPLFYFSGMRARFENVWDHSANFTINKELGQIPLNGEQESLNEPVPFVDKMSKSTGGVAHGDWNATASGWLHSNCSSSGIGLEVWGGTLFYGGVTGGTTIADGVNIAAYLRPGAIINCNHLVIEPHLILNTPDGTPACDVSGSYSFDPESPNPVSRHQMTMDLYYGYRNGMGITDAAGGQFSTREPDRLSCRLTDNSVSATIPVGPGDASGNVPIGFIKRTTLLDSVRPGRAIEMEIPDGFGPFTRNGVQVPWVNQALWQNRPAGPKIAIYSHDRGGLANRVADESNNMLRFLRHYNAVRANGS